MDEWTPCDEAPVLYVEGGALTLFARRELVEGCALYDASRHGPTRPRYALMPHCYACPGLKKEPI